MRNSFRRATFLVVLLSAVLAATSCGPQPTAQPAPTPTVVAAATAAAPTSTVAEVATLVPEPPATPEAEATPAAVQEETSTPAAEVAPEEALYLPELPRISCEELKQLMDGKADLVMVDTRMDFSFNEGHLPRAINIPASPFPPAITEEMIEEEYMKLPRDKLIVLYCD